MARVSVFPAAGANKIGSHAARQAVVIRKLSAAFVVFFDVKFNLHQCIIGFPVRTQRAPTKCDSFLSGKFQRLPQTRRSDGIREPGSWYNLVHFMIEKHFLFEKQAYLTFLESLIKAMSKYRESEL